MSEFLELLAHSRPHRVVFAMIVVTVAVTLVSWLIVRRSPPGRKTDVDLLYEAARRLNTSEFQVFRMAAAPWRFSDAKTEEDFKRYLLSSEVPRYVSDWLRGGEGDPGVR